MRTNISFFIFLLLTLSCNNANNKTSLADSLRSPIPEGCIRLTKDSLTILTEDKFMNIYNAEKYRAEHYDDDEPDYPNPEGLEVEVAIGVKLKSRALAKLGYRKPSDNSFNARIKEIFGIDINHLNKSKYIMPYKDFFIYLSSTSYDNMQSLEGTAFSDNQNHLFFIKGFNYISEKPRMDLQQVDSITYDICAYDFQLHYNEFIFNNSQASLTWLINSPTYIHYLVDLIKTFNYDKNPRINEAVLQKSYREWKPQDKPFNNYTVLKELFAKKDLDGEIHVHENLLRYITAQAISAKEGEMPLKYLNMLNDYGATLLNPEGTKGVDGAFDYLTKAERYKIAAFIAYYVQKYYYLPIYLDGEPLPVDLPRAMFYDESSSDHPEVAKELQKIRGAKGEL